MIGRRVPGLLAQDSESLGRKFEFSRECHILLHHTNTGKGPKSYVKIVLIYELLDQSITDEYVNHNFKLETFEYVLFGELYVYKSEGQYIEQNKKGFLDLDPSLSGLVFDRSTGIY